MSTTTYTPPSNRIIHNTSVDFSSRHIGRPIHLVQYDDRLPIVSISLYLDNQPYFLSKNANASIRLGKPDNTFVYNPAIGCNEDRNVLYFEVTVQMVTNYGELFPIIEIEESGLIANSSSISFMIDRNPIQNGMIESTVEYKTVQMFADEAKKSAEEASRVLKDMKALIEVQNERIMQLEEHALLDTDYNKKED